MTAFYVTGLEGHKVLIHFQRKACCSKLEETDIFKQYEVDQGDFLKWIKISDTRNQFQIGCYY